MACCKKCPSVTVPNSRITGGTMDSMGGQNMALVRALNRKLIAPIADEEGYKRSKIKGTNHGTNLAQ